MDDSELLNAYLENGSEPAFAELVNRYFRLIYSAALRQVGGDAALAKDVVQVVFIDLARKATILRHRQVLVGWLYTSTRYAVTQVVRAEMRRKVREKEAEFMMQNSSGETTDAWSQLRPVIDAAMLELDEADRETILLRYFEGRPFVEIGEKLALPANTVRMRVERALDKMHALLMQRGVKSTAEALAVIMAEQAVGAAPVGLASEVSSIALQSALPPMAKFMQITTTTKTQLAVVAAMILAGAGGVLFQAQGNRQLRTDIDRLHGEVFQAAAAMTVSETKLNARQVELDGLRRLSASAAKETVAPRDASPSQNYQLMVLRTRASLAQRYGSLLRGLKLDPEKEAQFETLLIEKSVDQQSALHDLSFGFIKGASADNIDAINALKAEVSRDVDEQIHALLGDASFGQYQNYTSTLAVRRQVDETAQALRSANAALNDDEVEGLVAFVARAGADPTQALPDTLMAEAPRTLDQNQQTALAQLQAVRMARRKIIMGNLEADAKGVIHLPLAWGSQLDAL